MSATAGNAYKDARRKASMTQEHLALATGLSVRTIRRVEAGEKVGHEAVRCLRAVLGDVVVEVRSDIVDRRAISEAELRLRFMAKSVFAWVGGLHPVLFVLFFGMTLGLGYVIQIPSYPIAFPACVMLTYLTGRNCGLEHRQALDFVRGVRFLDGEKVELDDRRDALLGLQRLCRTG